MRQAGSSPVSRWFVPETLIQSLGIGLLLTVLSRLAGLGRGVLFARLLDRTELGVWAITQNTMQMLSVVLVFGIPAGLCRYVARHERCGTLRYFLGRVLVVSCVLGGILCGAGVCFRQWLAVEFYEDAALSSVAVLLCLGAVTLMAMNLVQGLLQGLRVYRINAAMLVAQSIGFAGLGAVLLIVWRPTALAGTWAFLLVSACVTAVPCWMLWKHIRSKSESGMPDTDPWSSLWCYSLGTWGSSAMFSLWGWLDRYMLIHFDSLSHDECMGQLGSYYIVDTITAPLLALFAGWSVQVQAHAVHLWETGHRERAGDLVQVATKFTVLATMVLAMGAILFKSFLLVSVFGDKSLATSGILELGLVTVCLLAAQSMVRCYVLCRERVWTVSIVWASAMTLSCVCNFLLIPLLHLKGAAITAAISALVSTWLLMRFTHRAGLKLARSTWLATLVPLTLLLPMPAALAGLGLTATIVVCTDWLFTDQEKRRLREAVVELMGRRLANNPVAAT